MGEIDLIASRGGYLAFVEVKLRKDAAFAQAREFVTRESSGASSLRRSFGSPAMTRICSPAST
ncbi:MAG: YraN family protein [Oscillospiraceae bacterium]